MKVCPDRAKTVSLPPGSQNRSGAGTWHTAVWLGAACQVAAVAVGADQCGKVVEKSVPGWRVETGKSPSVIWQAPIGSEAGTPVVHKGRVLVGSNSAAQLDGRLTEDRAVMMCFG